MMMIIIKMIIYICKFMKNRWIFFQVNRIFFVIFINKFCTLLYQDTNICVAWVFKLKAIIFSCNYLEYKYTQV